MMSSNAKLFCYLCCCQHHLHHHLHHLFTMIYISLAAESQKENAQELAWKIQTDTAVCAQRTRTRVSGGFFVEVLRLIELYWHRYIPPFYLQPYSVSKAIYPLQIPWKAIRTYEIRMCNQIEVPFDVSTFGNVLQVIPFYSSFYISMLCSAWIFKFVIIVPNGM